MMYVNATFVSHLKPPPPTHYDKQRWQKQVFQATFASL